jgi:hypothetical protein
LARQGSSHPLTGQGPGLSITANVARGVWAGAWQVGNTAALTVHVWTKAG